MASEFDFSVGNQGGSFLILTPHSPEAREWVETNIPDDAIRWRRGIVVEPRYIDDIVSGIRADALSVA